MRPGTAWDAPGAVVECTTRCLGLGNPHEPRTQCKCIAILLVFAGLHYWQSWPWAAFDDDDAASTSRKRNIALRACAEV